MTITLLITMVPFRLVACLSLAFFAVSRAELQAIFLEVSRAKTLSTLLFDLWHFQLVSSTLAHVGL